ncbi:MAG: hypothetical protein DWP95_05920 [Proteobacteria bacterium]|nr:MAG: hypothetical protein DWP95_05920 [Pseudomonadota bacterium]
MKSVNEYIARMANEEDRCTGHFWESRFKSQALLDERALLTCMAYVDLNPIRACMAKSLSDSEYTSIKERIESISTDLLPFGKGDNDLPYYLSSYIDMVDETGRIIRDDAYRDIGVSREQDAVETKAGYISHKLGLALTELELNPNT